MTSTEPTPDDYMFQAAAFLIEELGSAVERLEAVRAHAAELSDELDEATDVKALLEAERDALSAEVRRLKRELAKGHKVKRTVLAGIVYVGSQLLSKGADVASVEAALRGNGHLEAVIHDMEKKCDAAIAAETAPTTQSRTGSETLSTGDSATSTTSTTGSLGALHSPATITPTTIEAPVTIPAPNVTRAQAGVATATGGALDATIGTPAVIDGGDATDTEPDLIIDGGNASSEPEITIDGGTAEEHDEAQPGTVQVSSGDTGSGTDQP